MDADCETAKTCSVCNKTEGEPLGHTWVDADCETAKTCSVCNQTDGEALGHKWTDATCTTPKTCSVCDKTEGDPLPKKNQTASNEAVNKPSPSIPEYDPDCGISEEDWNKLFGSGISNNIYYIWTPDHSEGYSVTRNENGGFTIIDPNMPQEIRDKIGSLIFYWIYDITMILKKSQGEFFKQELPFLFPELLYSAATSAS